MQPHFVEPPELLSARVLQMRVGLPCLAPLAFLCGCYGGHTYRHTFSAVPGNGVETLVLRYFHEEEPPQFLVYQTDQGHAEWLTLTLSAVRVGRPITIDGGAIHAKYAHGPMAACEEDHREITGAVEVKARTERRVSVSLDVVVNCSVYGPQRIQGTFDFEPEGGRQ